MADDRIWTAAELEALPAAERDRIIEASWVLDLNDLPPAFLARVRADGRLLLQEHGLLGPDT